MQIKTTKSFDEDYRNLNEDIKKRANKQINFLFENPRHPSLKTKKIKGEKDIWEARVTKSYRFTFQIIRDTCLLRRIGKHEDVLKNP